MALPDGGFPKGLGIGGWSFPRRSFPRRWLRFVGKRTAVRRGNRRRARCPACSETYRADTYQLIKAGLVGGQTVPETVAAHPKVLVAFTPPSFGPVQHHVLASQAGVDRSRSRGRTVGGSAFAVMGSSSPPTRVATSGSGANAVASRSPPTSVWSTSEDAGTTLTACRSVPPRPETRPLGGSEPSRPPS